MTEVTEASLSCWVVVHLFNDSLMECTVMGEALLDVAARFQDVKFVKIKSTTAVENWPDENLPTLFLYRTEELQHKSLTLRALHGLSMKSEGA